MANTQEFLDALHEPDKIAQMLQDLNVVQEMQKFLADSQDPDYDMKKNHIGSDLPIILNQPQVINADPAIRKVSKELMTVGSFFEEYGKLTARTMSFKGTVNAFSDIVETGIYSGTDLTYSPIAGQVMVMASKDDLGNFGYFLMGSNMELHVGGKPIGTQRVNWNKVADPGSALGLDARGVNLVSDKEVELKTKQSISSDPAVAGKDNRLMSVASVLKALSNMNTALNSKFVKFGDLERPAVVSAYTATPTKAELVTAAKLLPHYTNDAKFWTADHDFYVQDSPQTKIILVKYRGDSTSTDESKAFNFFFEKLTLAS